MLTVERWDEFILVRGNSWGPKWKEFNTIKQQQVQAKPKLGDPQRKMGSGREWGPHACGAFQVIVRAWCFKCSGGVRAWRFKCNGGETAGFKTGWWCHVFWGHSCSEWEELRWVRISNAVRVLASSWFMLRVWRKVDEFVMFSEESLGCAWQIKRNWDISHVSVLSDWVSDVSFTDARKPMCVVPIHWSRGGETTVLWVKRWESVYHWWKES